MHLMQTFRRMLSEISLQNSYSATFAVTFLAKGTIIRQCCVSISSTVPDTAFGSVTSDEVIIPLTLWPPYTRSSTVKCLVGVK